MATKYGMTEATYYRTDSGKSWKAQPDEKKTGEIDEATYERFADEHTMKCFRRTGGYERAEMSYEFCGFKVSRLTSINPSRTKKIVREFTFKLEK